MARTTIVVALVVTAAIGTGAALLVARAQTPTATPPTSAPLNTTAVVKVDLSDTQSFAGTLGFGGAQPVKGAGTGLLTKLPKPGDTTERGTSLYWVNDRPVPVFFGDTPLFRKLEKPEDVGRDVAVVADNLAELGYAIGTRASTPEKTAYTEALGAAVKRWQRDTGLEQTGTLDVGQVLVLPGPARVNSVKAQPGDEVAGELMSVTSTAKVVTVPVAATEVSKLKVGAAVTVVRPDAKEVPATITAVSTTAVDQQNGQAQQGTPKVDVTVTPADAGAVADLDAASVQVKVTTETHAGVLAVPVGALVALREGGYALQLPGGELKAVQTGMFAKELVEVKGAGVEAGLKVVTTS